MESYKHSCPFCGQHIEYTIGYCGKQMVCPICEKTVTFPAIPPGGKGASPPQKKPEASRVAQWSVKLNEVLAVLRQFQHWNVVLMCLVPFGIVAALLIGASVVRKKIGDEPAMPSAPIIQAKPNAWQSMTNLARADQLVQDQISRVNRTYGAVKAAERNRASVHAYFHDQATGQSGYVAADQTLANAQAALAAARQSFNTAYQNYLQLGGKVDYQRQVPQQ